ncbi:hypothetical protein M8542_17810 [Amycolatopsis sp. OK19-0408]|uniref:Uncharacterized protein n=1 Tax=Amycolatopsis iheyensis TaxID=2945988 RepID=A0A9X2NCG8_9PSEU|nr:hypothetical protein [Amycolatopsis iheyensis]MCR6484686.1 hypothetical protein [Amycolatopsis iheyensis]
MGAGGKQAVAGPRSAVVLALIAIGYLAGVAVAAVVGSAEPWAHGLFGIVPALVTYYAESWRRCVR